MTSLAPHIEEFLRKYLVRHRGGSQHTCEQIFRTCSEG